MEKEKIILGIDPGTNIMGYGVLLIVDKKAEMVTMGVIDLRKFGDAYLKLGAREAVGYDIDEWSVDNARHNAVINGVDDRLTALLGDASILNKVEGTFDIVMANINRNILLADMAVFVTKMAPGATLLLSGFYTEDIPLLVAKAEELGLTLTAQREDQNWASLRFTN